MSCTMRNLKTNRFLLDTKKALPTERSLLTGLFLITLMNGASATVFVTVRKDPRLVSMLIPV